MGDARTHSRAPCPAGARAPRRGDSRALNGALHAIAQIFCGALRGDDRLREPAAAVELDDAYSRDAVFPVRAVAATLHALRHLDQRRRLPAVRLSGRDDRWPHSREDQDRPRSRCRARCWRCAWKARRCSCRRATRARSISSPIPSAPRSAARSPPRIAQCRHCARRLARGDDACSSRDAAAISVWRCSASGCSRRSTRGYRCSPRPSIRRLSSPATSPARFCRRRKARST